MKRPKLVLTIGGLIVLASIVLYLGGIVFGMTSAFDRVAELKTSVSPDELAGSIRSSYVPKAYVLVLAALGVVVAAVGAVGTMAADKVPDDGDGGAGSS